MVEHEERVRKAVDDALRRHQARRAARRLDDTGLLPLPDHPSHARFVLSRQLSGSDSSDPCLIEPAVACTHCGYCLSYGH